MTFHNDCSIFCKLDNFKSISRKKTVASVRASEMEQAPPLVPSWPKLTWEDNRNDGTQVIVSVITRSLGKKLVDAVPEQNAVQKQDWCRVQLVQMNAANLDNLRCKIENFMSDDSNEHKKQKRMHDRQERGEHLTIAEERMANLYIIDQDFYHRQRISQSLSMWMLMRADYLVLMHAFLMGTHDRLGAQSSLRMLNGIGEISNLIWRLFSDMEETKRTAECSLAVLDSDSD